MGTCRQAASILDQLQSATVLELEIERAPGTAEEESDDDDFVSAPVEWDMSLHQLNPNLKGLTNDDNSDGGSDASENVSD